MLKQVIEGKHQAAWERSSSQLKALRDAEAFKAEIQKDRLFETKVEGDGLAIGQEP